uniref:ATP-binding cassette, sub-family A (ABC1), member 3b n=1 Tax=Eptatretus burgeri TaxID=7764 RepID=A0A8C4X0D4_EPTBU
MAKLQQFGLLLWKNYVLQKRQVLVTIIELALPALFAAILIAIRQRVSFTEYPNSTYYRPLSVDRLPQQLMKIHMLHYPEFKDVGWFFAYSPGNATPVREIASHVEKKLAHDVKALPFETEKHLIAFIKAENRSSDNVLAAMVIHHNFGDAAKTLPKKVRYDLRFKFSPRNPSLDEQSQLNLNHDYKWETNHLFPAFPVPGPRESRHNDGGTPGYYREGFLAVQHCINSAIILLQAARSANERNGVSTNHSKLLSVPAVDSRVYRRVEEDPSQTPDLNLHIKNLFDLRIFNNSEISNHSGGAIAEMFGKAVGGKLPTEGRGTASAASRPTEKLMGGISRPQRFRNATKESDNDIPEWLKKLKVEAMRFPYPPYHNDLFVLAIQMQLPLLIVLSFVYSAVNIVRALVTEKESKLKEYMRMMGLSNWLHWSAWFFKSFALLSISSACITAILCIQVGKQGAVLHYSDPSLVFCFILIFALSTITFCFMISSLFSKANVAATAGGFLYLLSYVPYLFVVPWYDSIGLGLKLTACLGSNVAIAMGGQLVGVWEGKGVGLQWSQLWHGVSAMDPFCMGHVLAMLLLDCVLYTLIAVYVEAVFPGQYGIPQPAYFFLLPSYWLGNQRWCPLELIEEDSNCDWETESGKFFEHEPYGAPAGIRVQNLYKVFGKGKRMKAAVKGLTMNMYEGQITALLGHNGAGKTTTLSILTGLFSPSHGTALVNGCDIRYDMSLVRRSLGLCPQHDVLFMDLTVEEHLIFFAKLKGNKHGVEGAVAVTLRALQLEDKRYARAKTLSGGMRRKLSIGIAFIGNPKVVLLDEPTSGMDPVARRAVWDVVLAQRRGRTILLTTHFMEEAEVLADRLAILAHGRLQCCGSPLFLKHRYGAGYRMVVVKRAEADVAWINKLVQSHIPDAELARNAGAELAFILPTSSTHMFVWLFTELERRREELGITSYGVSVTPMEEVFLSVSEKAEARLSIAGRDTLAGLEYLSDHRLQDCTAEMDAASTTATDDCSTLISEDLLNLKLNTGIWLLLQQSWAMVVKRTIYCWRNWRLIIVQFLVPLVFTTIALIAARTLPSPHDSSPIDLGLVTYGHQLLVPYAVHNGTFPSVQRSASWPPIVTSLPPMSRLAYASRLYWWLNDWPKRLSSPMPMFSAPLLRVKPPSTKLGSMLPANRADCFVLESAKDSIAYYLAQSFGDQLKNTTFRPVFVNQKTKFSNGSMEDYLVAQATAEGGAFNEHCVTAAYFLEHNDESTVALALFNDQGLHTPAVALQLLHNGVLHAAAGLGFTIQARNFPLPRNSTERTMDQLRESEVGFAVAFNIMYGLASLTSSFAVLLVIERSGGSRHIQQVTGVRAVAYWLPTFLWDLLNFMVPCCLILGVFASFRIKAYVEDGHLLHVLLILLLHGWAVIPLMYLLQHCFVLPASAYARLTMFNILSGTASFLTVNILRIPELELQSLADRMDDVFLVLPNYCLGQSLSYFYENYQFIKICTSSFVAAWACQRNNITYKLNYLAWQPYGIGRYLVAMAIQGFVCLIFICLLELGVGRLLIRTVNCIRRRRYINLLHRPQEVYDEGYKEDEDVARERLHVHRLHPLPENEQIVAQGLRKVYGIRDPVLAVEELSLAIPPGECFGLLGFNGAGKSTTFRMLTGEETPTAGNAMLAGYSLASHLRKAQQRLGYCPQSGGLLEHLTGRENLRLIARLRGAPECHIPGLLHEALCSLHLQAHADRLVQDYSGGTKRRLSVAVALLGSPPVILLDEPSTGIDPLGRRLIWGALTNERDDGSALLITSHSMDECEALCTRLGIMVNGRLRCLGSPQHLKSRYGSGYTLLARVGVPSGVSHAADAQPFKCFVESTFPGSILKDQHQSMVHYHLTDMHLSWAEVFDILERAKMDYCLEDYSISQISLEQVFLGFAQLQRELHTCYA